MSDKPVDKTIFVLHRMEPLIGRSEDAKKLAEEWFEFIKKMPDCRGVDVICSVEKQLAWLEEWTNRAAYDKFNEEHFSYADFSVRMMDCSRGIFTRYAYRRLA